LYQGGDGRNKHLATQCMHLRAALHQPPRLAHNCVHLATLLKNAQYSPQEASGPGKP
jgi:hypothetical protein